MANITVDIKKKSIDIGSNLVAIGKGGMNPGVYDPQEIKADVFDMDNMVDGVDKHYLTTEQIEEFEAKQDALTAGDNIDITNNVISATDTTYTAGDGISIDENNVISNTRVSAEWGNIEGDIADQTDLQEALSCKQDVLTAGENVQIEDNVISATDTTYTAGQGISIDENNVISNTQTSAEWGNIQGDIADQTDLQEALSCKQDTLTAGTNVQIENNVISATDTTYEACDFDIKDLSDTCCCRNKRDNKQDTIAAGTNIQIAADGKTISATDTIPNDATITIQRNNEAVGCFTTDQGTATCINIEVPTQACDIGAMPDSIKYGASLSMTMDSSTYCLTMQLKDQDGCNLGNACCVDLPIESMVVGGCYLCDTKEIELILQNGCCICFGVGDLVSGLQTEITCDNKLDADLVDDTSSINKFVTCTEKNCINSAVQPGDLADYAQCCDIPTDNCQLNNGCGYTTCTGTLVESDLQPYAKSCDLATVATSGKYCDLDGRVTDNCQIANSCGFTTCTGTLVASDIENLAQCCDIPTDNCQLTNSCGYTTCTGTVVAGDLEPYAKSCDLCAVATSGKYCDLDGRVTDNCQIGNSCGYTTCTGTLVASDIENLAQCCDIPTDNCQLSNSCGYTTCTGTVVDSDLESYVLCCDMGDYQTKDCMVCDLTSADNDHYPTAKAVTDAMECLGAGDMLSCVYDPCGCGKDVFNYCNHYNTPTIPTDNCQLSNGCGFTTCTGTLVASDIECLAQCCDIPTDNCQLTNGCGYIKGINCTDVTTALGYTPYDCTNPSGYTTCTGTLVACDIANLAQCCDIPTDNCQLANGCDYATCCYVNDSINSVTAYYITKDAQGNQFATHAELSAATTFYSGGQTRVPTKNDYTIVLADEDHDDATTRYIYNSTWEFQYVVNETALTQAQLDALNSGITCTKVNCYDNCMAQCCDIPTDNCQLANGCGYITGISCSDVTSALGYTPYDSTNPNGYTTCTGTLVASDIECLAQCCDVPTDNCQLANSCGYTTCTGTLVASDIAGKADCSDIPTDNCQLSNSCGYTTCTGTLVASDIECLAQCCDIPTDNCQLSNSCGYTTCTGTLVQSDIQNLAQCCDIPTDNCQLANSCGYTTCTGTLQSCDIATINGCCLTNGGSVCIQGGIMNDTTCTTSCIEAIWSGTKAEFDCLTRDSDKYYIVEDEGSPICYLQACDIACINGCCLTNGGNVCLDGLPSQTGCCGKFLTTDGCTASWGDVPAGGIQNLEGSPICIYYKWTGTQAQFECLGTYRCDTEYSVV